MKLENGSMALESAVEIVSITTGGIAMKKAFRLFILGIIGLVILGTGYAQEVPKHIEDKIRQIYAEKYPDNFSMQKTLINDQLESYRFMQDWKSAKGVPQDIFNKIKRIYAEKYPFNFSMQKTLVKDQVESYVFIKSYTSAPGLPQDVFNRIKKKYQSRYPYNFSMQKTLVKDQVQSYIELHKK